MALISELFLTDNAELRKRIYQQSAERLQKGFSAV